MIPIWYITRERLSAVRDIIARRARTARSTSANRASSQRRIPSDIDERAYQVPTDHPNLARLLKLRKDYEKADGRPEENWHRQEAEFVRKLMTNEVACDHNFPLLTRKKIEDNNWKRYKYERHRYRTYDHYQEKEDKSNWNFWRKTAAEAKWSKLIIDPRAPPPKPRAPPKNPYATDSDSDLDSNSSKAHSTSGQNRN